MVDGKYAGQGTVYLNNGTKIEGYWQNKTSYISKQFYEIEKLYNSTPSMNLSISMISNWKAIGPFNFKKYYEEKKLL